MSLEIALAALQGSTPAPTFNATLLNAMGALPECAYPTCVRAQFLLDVPYDQRTPPLPGYCEYLEYPPSHTLNPGPSHRTFTCSAPCEPQQRH